MKIAKVRSKIDDAVKRTLGFARDFQAEVLETCNIFGLEVVMLLVHTVLRDSSNENNDFLNLAD